MPRINKYLTQIGYCSRRQADKLIQEGRVHLNDKVATAGDAYETGDELTVDFENVVPKTSLKPVYLAFNKPKRIVCTTDTKAEKDNIIDFINYPQRIFPIGRLDKLSEGLILLTNDGDIVNKILRAENAHEKEYEVVVNKEITPSFVKRMAGGLPILGTKTKKCTVIATGSDSFKIILTQGLNRQIRRMCEFLGYKVVALKRTRIMHISLDLPVGHYRELSDDELQQLKKHISDSSKIASPETKKPRKRSKAPSKSPKTDQQGAPKQSGSGNHLGKSRKFAKKSAAKSPHQAKKGRGKR